MRVFQIGAAGNVGRRLAALLSQRGDSVTGMHRSPEQAEVILAAGAKPVRGDLISNSIDDLAAQMAGHDAVVFSAGAHGAGQTKTTQIDGLGLEKAVDAARSAGISRFVLVSAFPESERTRGLGDDFEHYMRTKKTADVYLAASGLNWVIVRPGLLTDVSGDGLVSAGMAVEYDEVSRDHVAMFIEAALHEPSLDHIIVELTDGPEPLAEAVARLASTR